MAPREKPDLWRLVLPGYFPPTLNNVVMAHWSTVRKHKKRAIENLHVACLLASGGGGVPVFEGHVRVTITRWWGKGQRALEIENLYGAVKPLVDAMRAEKASRNQRGRARQGGLGIIEDDDPKTLALTVFQERNPHGDELATLIVVEGRRVA